MESELQAWPGPEAALVTAHRMLEVVEQRWSADLQALMDALESFNQGVSHDLSGPLLGIETMAQFAARAVGSGDRAQALKLTQMIERQARRASGMVAGLLALARVGHGAINRRTVAMAELVEGVVAELRQTQAAPPPPDVVIQLLPHAYVDAGLVRVAFQQLLGNAFKFLSSRVGAQVQVGTETSLRGTVYFVQDNGPGIAPEVLPRLFEPFQRLPDDEAPGHGVGLSIVKRIVERHGGLVWADTSGTVGAKFCFTLNPSPARASARMDGG
jgi:signal transduction histidine kinase